MQPGWYQDPSGRFPLRWHDGGQWTPQVMDGWQRPAVDPVPTPAPWPPPAAAAPPAASAPPVASAPPAAAPPMAAGTDTQAPPPQQAPPSFPQAPPPTFTQPPPVTPSFPQAPPQTPPSFAEAVKAGFAPPPGASKFPPAGRYALVAASAVLMLLGLFALPWIGVDTGHGTTSSRYPDIAKAVTQSNGATLNWWQHLYLGWFAVVLAFGTLIAVTATIVRITSRSQPVPSWSWIPCLVAFALMFAHIAALPDIPAGSRASFNIFGVGSVFLAYLLLACACPTSARIGAKAKPAQPA